MVNLIKLMRTQLLVEKANKEDKVLDELINKLK